MTTELIPPLLSGLKVTVMLTLGGALFAVAAAVIAGLARLSLFAPLRWLAAVYIEIFRGTSALVQLFWFYFVLPLLGVSLDAITVGVLVLGLNAGAYGAEVVRGAIQAVPGGQWEAAISLNLSRWQTMQRIVLPQAVPAMLPPAGNLLIELLKNTALVSLITITDLTFSAQILRAETLKTTEIFSLVLLIYFAAAMVIALLMRLLERWLARVQGRAVT
jgi:polar amino acid transport system permease protein